MNSNSQHSSAKEVFARKVLHQRIQNSPKLPKPIWRRVVVWGVIVVIIFYLFQIVFAVGRSVSSFSPMDILWSLGTSLEIDEGRTNFLLLGRGGGNHPGANLTDTIMVVSLNHASKTVSMLSIPRDMFVNIRGFGEIRINEVYVQSSRQEGSDAGNAMIAKVVSEMIDMPIHYYVNIDFSGFSDLVDALEGIDLTVTNSFTDYNYPNDKTMGWMTVSFQAGLTHLSGFEALAFTRSRHGNNGEGSDFARARRQQLVLGALRDRLDDMGWLSSSSFLTSFFEILKEKVMTDLTVREVISLGKIAQLIDSDSIFINLLTDGYDGFLYAPTEEQMMMYYNGQFVLLPLGDDYTRIQRYAELVFGQPQVMREAARIELLNGTGRAGVASKCATTLRRYGFDIVRVGNADHKDYVRTHVIDHTLDQNPYTLIALPKFTGGAVTENFEGSIASSADITVVLGEGEQCSKF